MTPERLAALSRAIGDLAGVVAGEYFA
jgi:hypothetical protein